MSETTKERRGNKQQWWKEQMEKTQQGHGDPQTMEQQQQQQQQREEKIRKENEERQRIQQQQQREEKIRKEHEEQQQLEDEQQDELDALCQKQKAIKKKREELEKEQRDKEEQLRKIQRALDEQRQLEEELNNQRSELIIRQRLERKELKEKQLKRKRYAPSSQYIKIADSDRDGRSCASAVSPSRKREDEEERRGQLSIIQAKQQSDVPKTCLKKEHGINGVATSYYVEDGNAIKNRGKKPKSIYHSVSLTSLDCELKPLPRRRYFSVGQLNEVSDSTKHITDDNSIDDLSVLTRGKICKKLDVKTSTLGGDYEELAGHFGMCHDKVVNIRRATRPTDEVLTWAGRHPGNTISKLREILVEMRRLDCVEIMDEGISSRSFTWSSNDLRKQETFHKSPSLATTPRDSAATLTGDEKHFGSKCYLDDVLEGHKQEYMMTHHQKKTKKHQKLTRDDISGPIDFRHIDHIGPEVMLDISPRTREICEKAQVTEEQLKDPKTGFVEANSPENPDHSSTFAFGSEKSKSKVKNKMSLEEKDKMKIKWSGQKRSKKHRERLQSLLEERTETRRVGPLRVCFDQEFLIGRGSYGTLVYAGFYKDGSEVAVKRLVRNATAEALFMENEKEISQLVEDRNSENIVRYRKFGRAQNFSYIVLDLCQQTLANYVKSNTEEYLQRHGPRIIKEILTGLLVLHSGTRIVLHMDLKPENILVDWEDRMRLADFGISREVREGNTTVDTGQQKGTDGWTAVECIKREGTERLKPSRKSDIQVVGMISFYVLTKGEHLFGEVIDRTHNIINGSPVNLEKLTDDSARDFVSLLIRHNKDERPYAEEALNHPYLTF